MNLKNKSQQGKKDTTYQNMWDTSEALKIEFILLSVYRQKRLLNQTDLL